MKSKRLFDIIFSSCVLVFGAPLFLFFMLLVKCTSKGPIFYKGPCMGQNGTVIYCWKFRTMCSDAEKKLDQLLQSDPLLMQEWKTYCKLKNDPRITCIGKFLRKTSLDELPQFWNVLKGDLSIVGPRPLSMHVYKEFKALFEDKTDKILSIKPGITCIWQTCGRNLLTLEERVNLEAYYVDKHNFLLDLKIIFKTIPLIVNSKGAF